MSYRPTIAIARFLLSAEGREWLERATNLPGTQESHLADLSFLRRHLSPSRAAAILEQVQLQKRAASRFDHADQMLFTDTGLQQSTHPIVATHRARRFRDRSLVADLGCGLGSDTLVLAQVADRVLAVDRDRIRLLFARHNAGVFGLATRAAFVLADVLAPPFTPQNLAVFSDPGRRTEVGRRVFNPEGYEPPLQTLWERWGNARGLAIKVAPGIDYAAFSWADEVEIISLGGQVKEATLWCRDLATPGVRRRATLLPSGTTVTDGQREDGCDVKPAGRYLYEPDGAVIRAGLVRHVAAALGLWQLDRHIAYLSSDDLVRSPLVQAFEVEAQLPFALKKMRQSLRELKVGVLEIKKRGLALDPDAFRRQLRLQGTKSRTLILTRIGKQPRAFLCQRKAAQGKSETSCA